MGGGKTVSTEIDNQVVRLTFDNKQFKEETKETITMLDKLKQALGFGQVKTGLNDIKVALTNLPINTLIVAADTVNKKFSTLGTMIDEGVRNLERQIESMVRSAINSLNIFKGGLASGFAEYETQINAIQTIWANTKDKGTTLDQINEALDELNVYADKTIYNFTQMTRNIGTFTAAGVDLDTSVKAIQGIANLSAMSGASAEDASRAMYQLSQALAAGKVNLQDWNSVVNANIGGKTFQKVLIETAEELGTISGEFAEGLKTESLAFRETLKEGWITSDVLTASLAKFTDTSTELGRTATDAATKVKTFTQLIDTLKETVQSGWTQTWEYIIGDFEQARDLFTKISDTVTALVQPSMDARNEMLRYWSENGKLGEQMKNDLKIEEENAKEIDRIAREVIQGKYGNGQARFDALDAAGYDHRVIQNAVNAILGLGAAFEIEKEEATESTKAMTGRQMVLKGLSNIGESLIKIIHTIQLAFRDVFPPMTGVQLVALSEKFLELTERLKANRKILTTIRKVFRGLFSILKIGVNTVKAVLTGLFDVLSHLFSKGGSGSMTDNIESFFDLFWNLSNNLEKLGVFETIRESVGKLSVAIDFLIDKFKTLIAYISENGLGNTIVMLLSKAKDEVKNLGESFKGLMTNFYGNIKDNGLVKNLSNTLNEATKITINQGSIVEKLGSFGSAIYNALVFAGSKIRNGFKWLFDNVVEFVKNHNFNVFAIISDLFGKWQLLRIADSIYKFVTSVKDIPKAITNFLSGISSCFKTLTTATEKYIKSKTVEVFVHAFMYLMGALGSMVVEVLALGSMEGPDMQQGIWGMVDLVILMSTLMAVLGKVAKTKVPTGTAMFEIFDPSLMLTLIGVMGALATLSGAVVLLGKTDSETLVQGIAVIAGMTGLVIVLSYFFENVRSGPAGGSKYAAKAMIGMAVAINLMMLPLTALTAFLMLSGDTGLDSLNSAFAIIAMMMTLVGGLTILIAAVTKTDLVGVASVLIAFAVAISAMTIPILLITKYFNDNQNEQALNSIIGAVGIVVGLMGFMTACMILLSKFSGLGGSNLLAAAGAMILCALAITLLVKPIIKLASVYDQYGDQLWKVVGIIGALVGIFTIVTIVLTVIDYFAAGTLPLIFLSIAAMIVAVAPVLLGIALIISSVSKLISSINEFANTDFTNFGKKIKQVLEGIKENIPLAGEVITELIMTMAQVTIDVLPKVWEVIRTSLTSFITNLVGLVLDIVGTLLPIIWQFLLDLVLSAIHFIGDNADAILSTIAEVMGEIADAIEKNESDLVEASGRLFDAIWSLTKEWGSMASEKLGIVLGEIWDSMVQWGKDKTQPLVTQGGKFIRSWTNGIKKLKELPKTIFNTIFDSIKNLIQGNFQSMFDFGSDIIGNLVGGMESKVTNLFGFVSETAGGIINKFLKIFDINSPAGTTKEMGGYLIEGFGVGIKDKITGLWNTVKEAGSGLLTSFKDSLTGKGDGSGGIIDTIKGYFEGFDLQSLFGGENGLFGDFDLQSMLGDNLNLESTITPVLDLDSLNSSMDNLDSIFGSQSISLSDLNGSLSGSYSLDNPRNGSYNDTNILTSINRLNKKLDDLAVAITNLHIRMDTGALVGSIVSDMDSALGSRMALRSRGV